MPPRNAGQLRNIVFGMPMKQRKRIDLHTHSLISDGVLLPSELLRRAEALGHKALAITDHADASNLAHIIAYRSCFKRRAKISRPS